MRRGDVWLVNLDPAMGSEADKTRPAVIVSNDSVNTAADRNGRGVVTVAPITSNTATVYSFQVYVTGGTAGLGEDSKVQCEQLRAVDVRRLKRRIGVLPDNHIHAVNDALEWHLDL